MSVPSHSTSNTSKESSRPTHTGGRIPASFIDSLLARIDIVDLIGNRVKLKKRGREFMACCPFHHEKTPSFTVSPEKQFYHCFGCGAHGTAVGFVMAYERMEYPDAIRELAQWAGIPLPETSEQDTRREHELAELRELCAEASRCFQQQLRDSEVAIGYLKNRGLTGQIAAEFELGYAPDRGDFLLNHFVSRQVAPASLAKAGLVIERDNKTHYDRFRNRIIFPIHDLQGHIIGFSGRLLGDGEPKYLNSPETPLFHKGGELYALRRARAARAECLLVVEGYMDVIALAQAEINNVVATMGTAFTQEHARRVWRHFDHLVLCFDGDNAGRRAAWRALETLLPELRTGRQVRFMFLPDGHDPDTLVRREGKALFLERLEQAQNLSDTFCRHLQEQAEASVEGRAAMIEQARPLLAKVHDPVYRSLLNDAIAKITHVAPQLVEARAASAPTHQTRATPSKASRPIARAMRTRGGLVRQAIAIALRYPHTLAEVSAESVNTCGNEPGVELLGRLLALPGVSELGSAQLLERLRDDPEFAQFERLAQSEILIEREGAAAELDSILVRLRLRNQGKARVDSLIAKARAQTISEEEKTELRLLLGEADTAARSKTTAI